MVKEKRKPSKPAGDRQRAPEEASTGQYGGLKNLGPGGGRDIKDAIDPDDINCDDVDATRNG